MSYLIKIIVWLSTVVITGYLGCGLAIAEDVKGSSADITITANSPSIEDGLSYTAKPFDLNASDVSSDTNNKNQDKNPG